MTIDYQALLYDPVYAAIGVAAVLITRGGVRVPVTAIDKTAGVAVHDGEHLETVRPAALVRMRELSAKEVARTDVSDGQIELNGATWRIDATRPKPAPTGEADGELMLILVSEAAT